MKKPLFHIERAVGIYFNTKHHKIQLIYSDKKELFDKRQYVSPL